MAKPFIMRARATKRVTAEKKNELPEYTIFLSVDAVGEIPITGRMSLKSDSKLLLNLIGNDEIEITFHNPQTQLISK